MSITIIDPALIAQLRQAGGTVELKDAEGNVLGTFAVDGLGKLPPGVKSPFTREETVEAENDLAALGNAATDQAAITAAADWLDKHLARDPLHFGEPWASSVHRIAVRDPIGIEFEVIEDDKRVIVHGVFFIG